MDKKNNEPINETIEEEALRLQKELTEHSRRYYVLDDPIISDAEYDEMLGRLLDIEAAHPHLSVPDSPTRRVGAPPLASFEQSRHEVPMLSLDNAFSNKDVMDFHHRITRMLGTQRRSLYAGT